MNKYLIEILTALSIVIIVVLLVRMYSLETAFAVEGDADDAGEVDGAVEEVAAEEKAE